MNRVASCVDQGSPRSRTRNASPVEDFRFLEQANHVAHERDLEWIVHSQESAAHGMFRPYKSAAKYTRAAFLQDATIETPVFVRFSMLAHGAGSAELSRDIRRFVTKFYTSGGVFDLVGNNAPMRAQGEPHIPSSAATNEELERRPSQSASTFWDFISLTPESLPMVMWVMSDRAIPCSYRMMEGYSVHTFRMVDTQGRTTLIKWHWRPVLGTPLCVPSCVPSCVCDEDVKRNSAGPDFHHALRSPAWELAIQPTWEDQVHPHQGTCEEETPWVPIGKMVLDRWQNNIFAETGPAVFPSEQLVAGIELVNDATAEIPPARTEVFPCPAPGIPRSEPPINVQHDGADHHSRARAFWCSMTSSEQRHIASAFTFELSKVEASAIRRRMLGHLELIAPELGARVADALGMMQVGPGASSPIAPTDAATLSADGRAIIGEHLSRALEPSA